MADPVITWDDILGKCEEIGVLAKKFYVVFTSPANGLGPTHPN